MYLESINIAGYRNFIDTTIMFNEGINVIIGHNNAGKTNLLKALSLVMESKASRRLDIDDFNKDTTLTDLKQQPPRVTITLTIKQSKGEDLMSDDLAIIAPWLVELKDPYMAKLQYVFFLPISQWQDYQTTVGQVQNVKDLWLVIKHDFLRKYVHKIYGGDPTLEHPAEMEALQKFDFQFLTAIRDVERDLFTGKNTLLREVIEYFMDFDIKSDKTQTTAHKQSAIKNNKLQFSQQAQAIIAGLQLRMTDGKTHIMHYATNTGASFKGTSPDFDGTISEAEMYSALRLIISHTTGIQIPATHNGLGYNNLIYMSLLLAKMQVDTNYEYLDSNAKVFPMLVIEEPEAHLHPSLQYKFLKFLHQKDQQKARQVFITTHSTQITAAVGLDQIICLHRTSNNAVNVGYPGKVFDDNIPGEVKSKAYVQRFLDATRSDMLFAQNIIFVEGLVEELLLPCLASQHKTSLEDHHTVVVSLGGRYFEHFLRLFDRNKPHTIHKQVACLTDIDPTRKGNSSGARFNACYPFEFGNDSATYTYQQNSFALSSSYQQHANIRVFTQPSLEGKTIEYELVLSNPLSTLLFTDNVTNQKELIDIQEKIKNGDPFTNVRSIVRQSEESDRLIDSLDSCSDTQIWTDKRKWTHLLAARYLMSIDKGEHALALCDNLEKELVKSQPAMFQVPKYITDTIDWTCI